MLIHSASQLLTLVGGPQRGSRLGEIGIIEDGALWIANGLIADVGTTSELRQKYEGEQNFDAQGCVVMPGFVDPHTHAVWMGNRAAEFEMRLEGKTYLEIMAAGGGIVSTVRATREGTLEDLIAATRTRLEYMLAHGSTTIEVKSGYGLDYDTELRMLQAAQKLDEEGPWDLAFTFLAAHAVPPEYKDDPDGYVDLVVNEMLPRLKADWAGEKLPYVDVFCETGAFDLAQSRKILESAKGLGFPLKIHADEFDNLGGASLAAELGAASADHLVATSAEDIANLAAGETVAVSLPGTPFGLAHHDYTPAKEMIAADGYVAIATDLNPGTTWCESMQMMVALACRYMKLTPAQAIAAATINSAKAINMDDKVGSLEVGKQADVIVLDVAEYQQLGYRYGTNLVKHVFKKGQKVG